ncbi:MULTISPECIES: polysaccharide deacetylase family protein [unclassified Methanosarcina]|uniref:polysaccharide deacetylase family protein n=1 Tax=unclassified Methanosarcina TaxID=2644672 RepID=UPI000615435A|nr:MULTISPECIES: polysaccharide deacetylase family protein [unclassified Methanosarcina]AKB19291.1 Polysaccharide deacetylase [Methanosarcina sp. WWM596]AKB22881.1 Polysaccharide deacetylase [Methanosarcina sp. WH1]
MKNITITIDVEEDCPPMLTSTRGMEEGMPKLLQLFKKEEIKATFFVTGMMAEQYPDLIRQIPVDGHELGCHGYTHTRFDRMGREEAKIDLKRAGNVLRQFEKRMVSFRAPNLQFPESYLELLEEEGFMYDSSFAAYKPPFSQKTRINGKITRIPVTVTSSFLRLSPDIFLPPLRRITAPVIFVHPWEFVDMSKMPVRLDCKFNTGKKALENLKVLIHAFKAENCLFLTLEERASLEKS